MRLGRSFPSHLTVFLGGLCVAVTTAEAPAAAPSTVVRTPVSGGQPELAVGYDSNGILRAAICQKTNCTLEQGTALGVPESLAARRADARLQLVPIGEHRHAVHVSIPAERSGEAWQAVVVAKPGLTTPEIVFQGTTGYVNGEEGLRRGPTVEVTEAIDETGTRRILVGEQSEELTLCGRPAVLSPRMLTAKDLTLRPAKVQRLTVEERESATRLIAEPHAATTVTTPAQTKEAEKTGTVGGQASLLRAIGATSAIGWPAHLTDGNSETTWAENRGGTGRGEFVSFRAPGDVPLQSFEFVVRPQTREIKHGVGPEKLWLVTEKQSFSITFPSDPWKAPGVTWKVALPTPVRTNCVAIVTDTAYVDKPDAEVTLAEVNARSEFTVASIDNLIGALAGGGPRAEAAGTVLAGLGTEAYVAVGIAFPNLDEGGRRVALDILDHAPCADASPVYISALLGAIEAHRLHAVDRLRRCGQGAVGAIEEALKTQPPGKLRPVVELLAEVAPDKALRVLVPRLTGPVKPRRMLREVIGKAARSPKAEPDIIELLERKDLPAMATIDLLRALGGQISDYSMLAAANVERLLTADSEFRTKFLLLGPAHVLADQNRALAQMLVRLMRTDPNPLVRTEAVRTAKHVALYASDLIAALDDTDVRVRQAAAETLSAHKHDQSIAALGRRLKIDEWPIVRVAAAESLAPQPASEKADRDLVAALEDESWLVKVAAAESIGTRKVSAAGEPLLDLFSDKKGRFEVRIAAVRALGDICYDRALDKLTDAARSLKAPSPDPRDRALASSALDALAKIHPNDLAARLEPLLGSKNTPSGTRRAARAALESQSRCRMPAGLRTADAR